MFIRQTLCIRYPLKQWCMEIAVFNDNISHILRMQLLNSKAFYLKNYSLKSRSKTQPKQSAKKHKQKEIKFDDIMRIRNITSNQTLQTFMPPIKIKNESTNSQYPRNNSKQTTIYQREQDLLVKIYKLQHNHTKSRKWHSVSLNEDILVEKHPIAQVNSLEFESMKPTNRYFHKIENIRLAQKLLLAKPSRDINRSSQQKFYQQQAGYKMNISRLSFRTHEEQNKKRSLNRKKWRD